MVADSPAAVWDRNRLNLSWLIKLRWAQIAGQTATVLGVRVLLGIELPLAALFAVVFVGLLTNIACELWFRAGTEVSEWQLAAVMAVDVALLTALLYFTGGPFNPFSFLYLVQIALAAVVLHAYWTWLLVAVSLGSFGVLLLAHRPLSMGELDPGATYQKGMWVALGVASAFIVHFLLRITGALAERELELGEAKNLAARQERLASLATMAAGAAHELSTPLGTIALVAKEMERRLDGSADAAMIEDARLVREEVGRCRMILDQMAGGAGESAGEGVQAITVAALIDEALTGVRDAPEVAVELTAGVRDATLRLPPRAVAQALRSVITNAQDASPPERPVAVSASLAGAVLRLDVRDRGRGMIPEVYARVGEPFFTTKAPGRGMGLGIYLTRAVMDSIGGTVDIWSAHGEGTRVTLELPMALGYEPGSVPTASEKVE